MIIFYINSELNIISSKPEIIGVAYTQATDQRQPSSELVAKCQNKHTCRPISRRMKFENPRQFRISRLFLPDGTAQRSEPDVESATNR